MTDQETTLIQRIIQRDQHALSDLYNQYGRLVYNMARHVLQDDAAAEEVTQDVFFQVWRWPERWDSQRAKLTTWLLSIARYTAIDYLRREQRRPQLELRTLEMLSQHLPHHPAAEDAAQDNQAIMKKLMGGLPKEQRIVIAMAYYRGLTHDEIAQQLKLPLGTVKSRIRLGMKKLKEGWQEAVHLPENDS
jgi:RNA polymerase sigma-70 factor, ECF subfamily